MTSWSNSVEDPEKHFLGNLLDDDTSFSASPPTINRGGFAEPVTASGIPTASVINGVGPIGSSTGPSPFWPEPPPPYTPALQTPPGLHSWGLHSSRPGLLTTYDLSTAPASDGVLKDPSEWDFFSSANFLPSSTTVQQKSSGTTEIHHHQHTHQHTHVLQVINKHPYDGPAPPQFDVPPPVQQFASVAKKAAKQSKDVQRPQQLPPHSAPVVNRMPFSYRDVAARKETNSSGHSPTQQSRKVTLSYEGEHKNESMKNQETISVDSDSHSSSSKNSKQKTDTEFQKISRKKGSKEKRAVSDSSAPPPPVVVEASPPPVVDVPTRYQVLENLSSPKIVKADSVDSDGPVFTAKVEKVDGQEHSPPRAKRTVVETRKKAQPQPAKKRSSRKKNEGENWLFHLLITYFILAMEAIQDAFKWLMTLIVDVCSKMTDITVFGFFTVWDTIADCLRRFVVAILSSLISTFLSVRHTNPRQFFASPPPEPIWGLDENMALPTTTEEALQRLLRVRRVDAYAVLGLRADCSEMDIDRHFSRLVDLLNDEKTTCEGTEEADAVVVCAMQLIGNAGARSAYKLNALHKLSLHGDLLDKWDVFRTKIEEARHTMQCDCGKRHARIPTNIQPLDARYCRRCGVRHHARANDMWVESRLCGLAWVYFTCNEGIIYDITEWATCETNFLKHMRPNAHSVQYRLVSPVFPGGSLPAHSPDLLDDSWGSRSSAQVSFRPMEPREEDRSRRAANRRQKRR